MEIVKSEVKSNLAKLLAMENLTVEHRKCETASFDVKNRILYLPIWQQMSGDLYDLLVGHEVGHAFETPVQGLHDALVSIENIKDEKLKKLSHKGAIYRSYLNVIEDARVDKKMKRRYPGLKKSYREGYKSLLERDFFGIKNKNVNTLSFIDRLNIYTKSGETFPIKFSPEEMKYVHMVMNTETWEDVVRVTDAVFAFAKKSLEEKEQQNPQEQKSTPDSPEANGDDNEESTTSELKGDEEAGQESGSESNDDADTDDEITVKSDSKEVEQKESEICDDDERLESITEKTFREKETVLVDQCGKDYLYLSTPKPILKNIITPMSLVQGQMTKHYKLFFNENFTNFNSDIAQKYFNDFKSTNDRYVSMLAKEFEMRKAAKAYAKNRVSETGDIDLNKLSLYKFDDNIFKRITKTNKGKSHGLILLLDCSGSMQTNMSGSIEQIMILSMFCRKVKIPFRVFGFVNHSRTLKCDFDGREIPKDFFKQGRNTLGVEMVQLREYLNSNCSSREFNEALFNMTMLKKSYEGRCYSSDLLRPLSENLSNTPLIEAIIALRDVSIEFKKQNNLDIVNLAIVHDGDADSISSYYNGGKKLGFSTTYFNTFLKDAKYGFERPIQKYSLDETIYQWYTETTGIKIFGFFVTNSRNTVMGMIHNDSTSYEKFKSERFAAVKKTGFKDFYLIRGGESLNVDDENFTIEGKLTSGKLKSAFIKHNKKKYVSRVLVSRFIEGIAV